MNDYKRGDQPFKKANSKVKKPTKIFRYSRDITSVFINDEPYSCQSSCFVLAAAALLCPQEKFAAGRGT